MPNIAHVGAAGYALPDRIALSVETDDVPEADALRSLKQDVRRAGAIVVAQRRSNKFLFRVEGADLLDAERVKKRAIGDSAFSLVGSDVHVYDAEQMAVAFRKTANIIFARRGASKRQAVLSALLGCDGPAKAAKLNAMAGAVPTDPLGSQRIFGAIGAIGVALNAELAPARLNTVEMLWLSVTVRAGIPLYELRAEPRSILEELLNEGEGKARRPQAIEVGQTTSQRRS